MNFLRSATSSDVHSMNVASLITSRVPTLCQHTTMLSSHLIRAVGPEILVSLRWEGGEN